MSGVAVKVLIANRGEVAVRVGRAVRQLGWTPQYVHAAADAADAELDSVLLPGGGVASYLDLAAIVAAAESTGSQLIHPGWGFLSESPALAKACVLAGLSFVGPSEDHLRLFGDKTLSRNHAAQRTVPVLPATSSGLSLDDAASFLAQHRGGIMLKAIAGGGGRGMRPVQEPDQLSSAYTTCQSEAERAFGDGSLYAEKLLPQAKHIEVQVVADETGEVIILGERECSIQRQHQKLIEYAPSPALTCSQRDRLYREAESLFADQKYSGLATVEFLVDASTLDRGADFDCYFIEVNPRLQVEHTVTEELFGIDLVEIQLRLASGESLSTLQLAAQVAPLRAELLQQTNVTHWAMQLRINAERYVDGLAIPTVGEIVDVVTPEAVRVDTHLQPGTRITGTFDSLLAKLVVNTTGSFADAAHKADRALAQLEISGVGTNAELLHQVLAHDDFSSGRATTGLVGELLSQEQGRSTDLHPHDIVVDFAGTVVAIGAQPGQTVSARTPLITVESMKMEYPVAAGAAGVVTQLLVQIGDQVHTGQIVAAFEPGSTGVADEPAGVISNLEDIRPDLAELQERLRFTQDDARPEVRVKRHRIGHRTARENIADLIVPGSFTEYGSLTVAAQRSRRSLDDLVANTPADGIVTGFAKVASATPTGSEIAAAILVYDYTVLAGTQGYFSHRKTDRVLEVARERQVPVVLFGEGGGGRPGDTDAEHLVAAGLNVTTFATLGTLSGKVPMVGVLTGRSFAGNAAMLGCCDVIVATVDSNLGMAGPAMIEGGGLGRYSPDEIGPMSVQAPNGVVDVTVDDDRAAVYAVKRYLSYFDRSVHTFTAADQRRLRQVIGPNRKEMYDIRALISVLADEGSVFELREQFGKGVVTALVRIEGKAYGLIANNPAHLGGAIDADAADKMARFLQLCDAHGLGVVSICDTPGFMVGPDAEQTATVRHFSRLFVIGSQLDIPIITIVVRKGYGLGAQSMAAGSFARSAATIAWPTGEIGAMGLEGAVRLGYAKELGAIDAEQQREARFNELLDAHYAAGKAINGAMKLEFDEVIDPADTRRWITASLGQYRPSPHRSARYIDPW